MTSTPLSAAIRAAIFSVLFGENAAFPEFSEQDHNPIKIDIRVHSYAPPCI